METFEFVYYKTSEAKYRAIDSLVQTCTITAVSAPAAIDIFEANVGNLRTKYTLVCIQQVDCNGKPIGEPITLGETYVNKQQVN